MVWAVVRVVVVRAVRAVRRVMGIQSHFSLAAYIKFKVKNAVQFISDYEESIVMTLKDEGLDGVICGHIHHAEIKEMDGFLYVNTGDFVESCTAIVEHDCGRLELIRWDPSLISKVGDLVEDMTDEQDVPPGVTDVGAAV